ncbi:uncharacterized protein LOC100370597 [Saccoglossus kowalevskii]|uniref:Homeobox protein ceh-31-like n=1 Tax=Saccoglossus kowalevskii TaxID=10224 RepID=A0ABM0GKG0_SACKO|nr:PREDICTED: homeobox protein ceh-31-like [Saccoglossus kowalevskii]
MHDQIIKELDVTENDMSLEKELPSPTSSTSSDAGYGSGDNIQSSVADTDRTRVSRRKKSRNAFSDDILVQLEEKFQKQKYLMTDEREEFAQKIGLKENQIRTWFQNRRMRFKKQRKVTEDKPVDHEVKQLSPVASEQITKVSAEKVTSSDEPQPMTTIKLPTIPPVLPTSYFVPPMHSSHSLIASPPYILSAPTPFYQPIYPLPMTYSAPTYYPAFLGHMGMTRPAVGPVIGHPYSPSYPLVRHYPVSY